MGQRGEDEARAEAPGGALQIDSRQWSSSQGLRVV